MTRERKKRFNADRIVAFSAILISLCALVVSFYEVRIMRTQQKSSVWPHVQIGQSYNAERFALNVVNKGVGPAIIKSVKLMVDGNPNKNLNGLFNKTIGEGHGLSYANIKVGGINDQVLEAGYNKFMLSMDWDEEGRVRKFTNNIGRVSFEVIYSSILGDCWLITETNQPKACDCPKASEITDQFTF